MFSVVVVSFRTQAGVYDPAYDLTCESLALEEKLGSRPDNMIEIYSVLAHVFDQVLGLYSIKMLICYDTSYIKNTITSLNYRVDPYLTRGYTPIG